MNHFLSYKNCSVHYQVHGRGSTVVLLHGFLERSTMWDGIAEKLSKRYRVVAIDLTRGELGVERVEIYGVIKS